VNLDAGSAAAGRRIASTVAIAYLAVATFPAAYYALHPGLDTSWVYGLNHFFNSQYHFGRDVNFTYGPLGVLLYPANFGNDVLYAVLFRVTITVFFIVSLAMLAPGRWLGLLLFSTTYGSRWALATLSIFICWWWRRCRVGGHREAFAARVLSGCRFLRPAVVGEIQRRHGVGDHRGLRGPSRGGGSAAATSPARLPFSSRTSLRSCVPLGSCSDREQPVALAPGQLRDRWGYSVAMSYDPGWTDQRREWPFAPPMSYRWPRCFASGAGSRSRSCFWPAPSFSCSRRGSCGRTPMS